MYIFVLKLVLWYPLVLYPSPGAMPVRRQRMCCLWFSGFFRAFLPGSCNLKDYSTTVYDSTRLPYSYETTSTYCTRYKQVRVLYSHKYCTVLVLFEGSLQKVGQSSRCNQSRDLVLYRTSTVPELRLYSYAKARVGTRTVP